MESAKRERTIFVLLEDQYEGIKEMKIIDFNNDLTIALNRVCFSSDFKMFFTSRHSHCHNGLTIGVKGKSKEDYQLFLTIRHYGYDHSSNNGISEFSDAYDF